jgi:DNA-binding transcriptional regulator/RsmH inhibitor MraZ
MLRSGPNVRLDRHGNFRIPRPWRYAFGRKVVMFEEYNNISVVSAKEWRSWPHQRPPHDPAKEWRQFRRTQRAARVGPQGLVTIPPSLMHLAPVGDRVWLVGLGNHMFDICHTKRLLKDNDMFGPPRRDTHRRRPLPARARSKS